LKWLFDNDTILNQFLLGGSASSDKTFRALEIWHEIWSKDTASREGLYLRLAMAVALEHANTVHTKWYHRE
jgi:hypothetical protein